MKIKILITAGLLLLVTLVMGNKDAEKTTLSDESIRICSTPEISGLVESWTSEYSKLNPDIDFTIYSVNFSEFIGEIKDTKTLGFIVKRPDVSLFSEPMWQIVVGRDVIVAVINKENPFTETINKSGISPKELSEIIKNYQSKSRNQLLKNEQNIPIKIFIQKESEVQMSVSNFLGLELSEITSIDSKTTDELLATIQSDKYAIGFCNLADVTSVEQHDFAMNIKLLPIDKNGNGLLDYNENIYNNLENFERAVWIGKYPKSLINNIYAVSASLPENKNLTGFLSWIVTSGQQYLESNRYTDLVYNEMQSNLEKLNPVISLTEIQLAQSNKSKTLLLVISVFILVIIIPFIVFRLKIKSSKREVEGIEGEILNEDSIKVPGGLLFDKSHTWAFMEKDGHVKIGIDDFLQHVTGNITGLIMKEPGEKIAKKELVVTLIQEGKKINIYSSVSGIVKEINEDLVTFPSLINSSPYSKGWIYSVEPTNWSREMGFYKMAEAYRLWIKMEFVRLKDFIATIKNGSETAGHLVYQEGGELHDHLLQQMGPKVWEDFQSKFIDTADIN